MMGAAVVGILTQSTKLAMSNVEERCLSTSKASFSFVLKNYKEVNMKKKNNITILPIEKLEENSGQISGLPKNPRYITAEKLSALKESINRSPEFLDARPLVVYPHGTTFVVLCGNMRLRALKELGRVDAPCYVLHKDTDAAKLREYTIIDNNPFGSTDWDAIKLEWNKEELSQWSFELPDWVGEDLSEEAFGESEDTEQITEDEEAERMLCKTASLVASDILLQYDKLGGFSFVTPHTAKFDFIRFAYYGKEYPRYNSLAFHAKQFLTKGDSFSIYEGLQKVASGELKGERLRFACQDKFRSLISSSLAFGGAKMPLDFPASLARELINEYGNCGRILDPCAGWGGRLVGFLASDATEYDGTDASPYQCEGDKLIYDTFKDSTRGEKVATITCSPFEKKPLRSDYFDMAITSPPYFDTEKYIGGEQSREQYSGYEEWRNGFYRSLIEKVFDALKADGVFCLQVGSQRYPLLDDGLEIAESIGFELLEVRDAGMANNQTKTPKELGEVVIILKKRLCK